MDEIETEGSDWARLGDAGAGKPVRLVAGHARFPVDRHRALAATSSTRAASPIPAAHRSALIRARGRTAEAQTRPTGPVIAAGSTGSIPATAELLSAIARLPRGAVVLPGLDREIDERVLVGAVGRRAQAAGARPSAIRPGETASARSACCASDVEEIGAPDAAAGAARAAGVAKRCGRPKPPTNGPAARGALAGERHRRGAGRRHADRSAQASATRRRRSPSRCRQAIDEPGSTAALVTGDRELARRVSAELLRFGIRADDSGGTPLANTPPAALLAPDAARRCSGRAIRCRCWRC